MTKARITLFFLILSLGFSIGAVTAGPIVLKLIFGNASLSFLLAALGYAGLGPRVFLKRSDGRVPFWGYLLLWPYFMFYWLSFVLFQSTNRSLPYYRVSENLFLGRVPTFVDRPKIEEIGISNVLDLAGELPEPKFLRDSPTYLFVPLMDTEAPRLSELEETVAWIRRCVLSGPTFVHCAFGHGRSVTLVTAYLLSENQALTVEEVIHRLRDNGRTVHLSKGQEERLHQFRGLQEKEAGG
jgi:protein-tyrosine phosphatase